MARTYTVRKTHPMANIAEQQMQPMTQAPIGLALDASMQGNVLASEVFATLKQQTGAWVTFAHRVFGLTPDARDAFMKAVKAQLRNIMSENMETHGATKKDMGKEVRSATVQVSKLVKIANAAQKGASLAGLGKAYGVKDPQHIGFNRVYSYAVDYLKAEGSNKGRPVTPLVVKLHKWLDTQLAALKAERPDDVKELDDTVQAQLQKLIEKYEPAAPEAAAE